MELTSWTATPQEIDTTSAVRRAVNGEVEAFGDLYRLYLDRIYRYVLYHVGNVMMAEDITEEVFIKAWRSIKSCRGKEQTFTAWLYRIAHNHMVDTLRKNSKSIPLELDSQIEIGDIAQQAESSLQCHQLINLISTLPEQQRQIIILKFIEGADNREIEQITGKHQGAIRILQMRGLATLREQLKMEVGGDGK